MNRIQKIVCGLFEEYNTYSPEEICEYREIAIIKQELPQSINGFFVNMDGEYVIVTDSYLCEEERRRVIAHELGHIMLHNEMNIVDISSRGYFYPPKYEKQADLFAAYLLLYENEISGEDLTREQISSITGISEDIIDLCYS